jgi:hypothetical protein
MLMTAGISKIHVCAPSNAAVDEILSRVSSRGLIGSEPQDLKKLLLRIGAVEHEVSPLIK